MNHFIAPGATLGVMGGGQLGRMFVHAAQQMGYFTAVLDADPASPAGSVAHHHIQADYLDGPGLAQLVQRSAAITTEFENVPAAALLTLSAERRVAPGADAVAVCQDRAAEKAYFVRSGVPCAPHALIASVDALAAVGADLLPGILKTARLGYDGKGQARVSTRAELGAAWRALGSVPCVLERLLPLAREISVLVARGADGQAVHLPVQQNLHRGGILAVTQVPSPDVTAEVQQSAVQAAQRLAAAMEYVGVLCVEFFVLQDGSLVANEMAPRPHNSGHHSIDSCDVSQFELQVRTLTGAPLVAPRQHSSCVMLNLMGDLWFRHGHGHGHGQGHDHCRVDAEPEAATEDAPKAALEAAPEAASEAEAAPDWAAVLALPGTHLHLYGKASARPGRKMGHLTVTAASAAAARAVTLQAAQVLGIEAF